MSAGSTRSPTAGSASLRADSARVRERMLAVAREMVAAGELEPPLNVLAKAAGVGVGTVYRHFATHQVLREALAAQSLLTLVDDAAAAAADPDVAAGLQHLLRSALRLQLADPALAAVLATTEAVCLDTITRHQELGAAIGRLLARAREHEVIRDDITAEDLRRLMSGIQHAVRLAPVSPAGADADAADRYLGVLLRGLRP